jgi:Zn-dependent protease
LPIGGLARLERMPEKPREELWVTVAGPAVNPMYRRSALPLADSHQRLGAAEPVVCRSRIIPGADHGSQCVSGLFNLIPAFPMDGGRMLRALLASRMEHVSTTPALPR